MAKTKWQEHLMKVYKEMKEKDPNVKLGDAMKEAKKTYQKWKGVLIKNGNICKSGYKQSLC